MLWLLRHADALDGQPDEQRPLSEKGRRQASVVGAALAKLGVHIDACLSSPRLRAVETATLACAPLGLEVHVTPELRGGPFDPEAVAAGWGRDVLLVGHEPDLSRVVHDLTGARVRMKKGGIAAIDRRELIVLMRPAELAAIAG
ncbi:MAG: putative phosphohistidine phosphatase, SixA [Conexibacter sp.]|nr:putative phosphohistidine phosphatase, SixA [Conexibacter sp.]